MNDKIGEKIVDAIHFVGFITAIIAFNITISKLH